MLARTAGESEKGNTEQVSLQYCMQLFCRRRNKECRHTSHELRVGEYHRRVLASLKKKKKSDEIVEDLLLTLSSSPTTAEWE